MYAPFILFLPAVTRLNNFFFSRGAPRAQMDENNEVLKHERFEVYVPEFLLYSKRTLLRSSLFYCAVSRRREEAATRSL